MTTYVIACVTVNPKEPSALNEYMAVTIPLLEKVGGRILQHFKVDDVVVGDKPAESIMIVEYPSIEAVHTLFDSEDYNAIIPHRDRAFSTYSVSIIG